MENEFKQIATQMLYANISEQIKATHIEINKPFLVDILQKFFLDNGETFLMEHIPDYYSSIMEFRNSSNKLLFLYQELKENKIDLLKCINYFDDEFYLKSLINLKLNYYL